MNISERKTGVEYKRHPDIGKIVLTPEDLANRGVVAVGYWQGELLPPYDSAQHEERANGILAHIKDSRKVITCESSGDVAAVDWKKTFPDIKVVEVVGGDASHCVVFAVERITLSGLYAMVDSSHITSLSVAKNNFYLGGMVLQGSSHFQIKNCLIFGREKYMYY